MKSMKLGITKKLFLAILCATVITALAILSAMRFSFHHGFLGYLSEQEAQRVESVMPKLVEAYRAHGNWDFIRANPRQWFGLIRPEGMERPGEHGPRGWHRPPHKPMMFPESELTGIMFRISLLDAEKKLIVGNPKLVPETVLKAVTVDGTTVGWVAIMPFQKVSTAAELRFQEKLLNSGWIIFAVALLVAALIAWLLARIILSPLKSITASTHQLAAGDYATRVPVTARDEVGQLAEDFNKLAVTLERNEKLRRDFMADISHELRTPLSVLKGELEAVEDGVRPMSIGSIRSLQTEVATLGKLVDDLYELSLSDVGALVYRKSPVDILPVLSDTVASFHDRFAARFIQVDLKVDPDQVLKCDADPTRLQQMFTNLLENAARYTDAGGRIEITCTKKDNMARIDFQDTAPGVPTEKLPHLFERFYRADHSRSRATGGSGLGLAISRNIVEAHHGTITAQASPLGGLWISIALPLLGKTTS